MNALKSDTSQAIVEILVFKKRPKGYKARIFTVARKFGALPWAMTAWEGDIQDYEEIAENVQGEPIRLALSYMQSQGEEVRAAQLRPKT